MALNTETDTENPWNTFLDEVRSELEQSKRALKEITLMLEQSQVELNKLGQRNSAITVHLQQIQSHIESLPRADIRMAYDASLDAQQRLFVMRGQLEKLQSDQLYLQKYVSFLEQTQNLVENGSPEQPHKAGSASVNVEMLINAQEAERLRLSRQMHDGPAQALSNFILQTEIATRMFDIDQSRARDELASLKMSAMTTFQKIRTFIFELRPMMLDDLGLIPTVKRHAESYKEQTGADVNVNVSGMERRFEPYLEVMIFRAVQELVGNAVQVSQATQVKIQIIVEDTSIEVSVDDNGKGMDRRAFWRTGAPT